MIKNWTNFAKGKMSDNKWEKFTGPEKTKIFNNGHGTQEDISLINDPAKLNLFKDCYIFIYDNLLKKRFIKNADDVGF